MVSALCPGVQVRFCVRECACGHLRISSFWWMEGASIHQNRLFGGWISAPPAIHQNVRFSGYPRFWRFWWMKKCSYPPRVCKCWQRGGGGISAIGFSRSTWGLWGPPRRISRISLRAPPPPPSSLARLAPGGATATDIGWSLARRRRGGGGGALHPPYNVCRGDCNECIWRSPCPNTLNVGAAGPQRLIAHCHGATMAHLQRTLGGHPSYDISKEVCAWPPSRMTHPPQPNVAT